MPSETHFQRRASLSDVRKREDDCEASAVTTAVPRCHEAEPLVLDQPERLPVVPDSVSCCAISYGTRGTRRVPVVASGSRQAPEH